MSANPPSGDEHPPQVSRGVRWFVRYFTPVMAVIGVPILVYLVLARAWDLIAVAVGASVATLVLHRWLWGSGVRGDDT